MSSIFYKNTPLGLCQIITFKQLAESSNLTFEQYIKIIDRRLISLLNISFENLLQDLSKPDEFNMDVKSMLSTLWIISRDKRYTIDDIYRKVINYPDSCLLISIVLQFICSAIGGFNMYKWKSDKIIHHVEQWHMNNVMTYILEMSKYTTNVAIICYQIWVNDNYVNNKYVINQNVKEYFINDQYVNYKKEYEYEKDKCGHVFVTFYNVKQKMYYNFNSNLEHKIVVHYPKLIEYVKFDDLVYHHGPKFREFITFTGGNSYNINIFIIIGIMAIMMTSIIVIMMGYINPLSINSHVCD